MEKKRTSKSTKCFLFFGGSASGTEVACSAFSTDYKKETVDEGSRTTTTQHKNCEFTTEAPNQGTCIGDNHSYRSGGSINEVKLNARLRLTLI